ncbi:GNAT family N-acetyltransferase [Pseudalkalibacillus sp. SCS-8]|uniref:GNAT family N-acetyltransferase n=1 Tax=Pseudalkalibacillus nanhaiensis TaxID=3115291 RepID=UPI0032DBABE4
MKIRYKDLQVKDLHNRLLEVFNRYQVTQQVWHKEEGNFSVRDDHFIDEWDDTHKARVIQDLKRCIEKGGAVIGAFADDKLVGFANVEGERFGSRNQYVELPYIHVSNEYRKHGIGKELFKRCCEKASDLGAEKVYIGAHPAVETQHFYRSLGCTYAEEINQRIYEKEPLDMQLEFRL